jgi:hypothetical protein
MVLNQLSFFSGHLISAISPIYERYKKTAMTLGANAFQSASCNSKRGAFCDPGIHHGCDSSHKPECYKPFMDQLNGEIGLFL